jgi:hypothetical protein
MRRKAFRCSARRPYTRKKEAALKKSGSDLKRVLPSLYIIKVNKKESQIKSI